MLFTSYFFLSLGLSPICCYHSLAHSDQTRPDQTRPATLASRSRSNEDDEPKKSNSLAKPKLKWKAHSLARSLACGLIWFLSPQFSLSSCSLVTEGQRDREHNFLLSLLFRRSNLTRTCHSGLVKYRCYNYPLVLVCCCFCCNPGGCGELTLKSQDLIGPWDSNCHLTHPVSEPININ